MHKWEKQRKEREEEFKNSDIIMTNTFHSGKFYNRDYEQLYRGKRKID